MKRTIWLIAVFLIVTSCVGCARGVSQAEYDAVVQQLADATGKTPEPFQPQSGSEKAIAENKSRKTSSASVWAKEPTALSKFDYERDVAENTIALTRYNGKSAQVWISGSYQESAAEYTTTLESATFFCDSTISSVIIGEGVSFIENNTFNSCSNLKYLYLPTTLSALEDGYSVFDYLDDNALEVYYGGTKEQWDILTSNIDSSSMRSFHIYIDSELSVSESGGIQIVGTKIQ